MPVYTYKCLKCGEVFYAARPIAERDEPRPCPTCNMVLARQLDAPMGKVDGPAVRRGE